MAGAIVLIFVMAVVFPPLLFFGGMVVAAVIGWVATLDAEARYEGTEHIELSRR